jgi:DNA-binding response OmpR family regulator
MKKGDSVHILLVEDNMDHVFLARKAINGEMGSDVRVHQVSNAEDAIEFLHQSGKFQDAPRPDLVLVDVQLPGKDGFWVVRNIKADQLLQSIPVVILTSSDAEHDIQYGYECGTNVYVCRPTGTNEFADRLKAIPAFWTRVAHLPPRPGSALPTCDNGLAAEGIPEGPA